MPCGIVSEFRGNCSNKGGCGNGRYGSHCPSSKDRYQFVSMSRRTFILGGHWNGVRDDRSDGRTHGWTESPMAAQTDVLGF